jgi:hypothetical protein
VCDGTIGASVARLAIVDRQTRTLLFMGRIVDPK